ncbi:hypothetical protein CH306_26665 [Rhodococcus sp. 15-725-2-2b]|nr:hypothetical protein CH277_21995 [Rhodococcus sp. 06-469-3-2]OZD40706.1 hypothetical protein CH264_23680 [Rhodococcus sp. 06-1477-1A]OZE67186.1 hypothetical protein CH306_26665 [Rhodococcus sp. 15-725-2-2b]
MTSENPTVTREDVEGTCSACASTSLQRYPVLSEGGWFVVIKCQDCLNSEHREPWHLFGPVFLTSHDLKLR